MTRIIIITPRPHPLPSGATEAEEFDVQAVDASGNQLTNAEKAAILHATADKLEAAGDVGQNVRDEAAAKKAFEPPALPDTNVNVSKADDKTGKAK